MVFRLFVSFLAFTLLAESEAFSQSKLYRDPFEAPFERLSHITTKAKKTVVKKHIDVPREPLDVTVEGLIVSDYLKQAVINGKIYKVGDTLEDRDAKIIKIDINKGVVSLIYNGMIYEKAVKQGRAK